MYTKFETAQMLKNNNQVFIDLRTRIYNGSCSQV